MTVRKDYWGEIKDPVHGYVYITEAEKEIIDSYPVQRLRRLRQLAGSDYVYPSGNHTRFEHCIGVMYLAGKVVENSKISKILNKEEAEIVRIAALLHDVGHGPFSHIFEQLLISSLNKTHEDLTSWIIEKGELNNTMLKMGFNPRDIAKLAVGNLHRSGKAFLDQIISSAVDVDKQDFILRDTFHTGAEYGFIDVFRLIHALDVLGENLAVELGALSALEAFMIARIESFKSIYFHRVGRAAQIMLATAMEKADQELGLTAFQNPDEYLAMDDYTMWTALKKCPASRQIIENLEQRKLMKCAYERIFYEKDAMISNIFGRAAYRQQIQSEIAKEAHVKPDAVVIDVPTVPSVPYHHAVFMKSMDIPVFSKTQSGEKKPYLLSDVSKLIESLKGFINILRVYTNSEDREKVELATERIFGKIPQSAKISY